MLPTQCLNQKGQLTDRAFFHAHVFGPQNQKFQTKDYDQYISLKETGWFDEEKDAKEFYNPAPAPKPTPKRKKKKGK